MKKEIRKYIRKIKKILNLENELLSRLKPFFFLSSFVRLLTGIVSIFSGFAFVHLYTSKIFDIYFFTSLTSICLLILIEFTAFYITSLFIYYLLTDFFSKKTLISFLFFILIFGFSVTSSTLGLAERQSAKIDNSEILQANYNNQIDSITNIYQNRISDIHKLSERIYVSTWKGRNSQEQLDQVAENSIKIEALSDELNKNISTYHNEFENAKNENKAIRSKEYMTYMLLILSLMVFQLLANGFIVYFDIEIEKDGKNETELLEARLAPNTDALLQESIYRVNDFVANIIQIQTDVLQKAIAKPSMKILDVKNDCLNEIKQNKQVEINGFKNSQNINLNRRFDNKISDKKQYIYTECLNRFKQPFKQQINIYGYRKLANEIAKKYGNHSWQTIYNTLKEIEKI